MTVDDLIETLRQHRALIVHCSRPGKGNVQDEEAVFPDDLRRAVDGAARSTGGLSCSVIWPAHVHTFGSVGIILRPRSMQSVSEICFEDAGSYRDSNTGKRHSHASIAQPLSEKAVADTFLNAAGYNEWIVDDADTVGIFVNLQNPPLLVPRRISVGGLPPSPQPQHINIDEIVSEFADLPVFAFAGPDIIQVGAEPYDRRTTPKRPCSLGQVALIYRNLAKEACSFVSVRF
jgi:hypothetical protein